MVSSLGCKLFMRLRCLRFFGALSGYVHIILLCNEIRFLFVMNKIKMGFEFRVFTFKSVSLLL